MPFVPTVHVVETYEQEILGRINEMKAADENPFGSHTAEGKINQFLTRYVEKTWIWPCQDLQARGPPFFMHKRWNYYFDCVNVDALTNNSSEVVLGFLLVYLS